MSRFFDMTTVPIQPHGSLNDKVQRMDARIKSLETTNDKLVADNDKLVTHNAKLVACTENDKRLMQEFNGRFEKLDLKNRELEEAKIFLERNAKYNLLFVNSMSDSLSELTVDEQNAKEELRKCQDQNAHLCKMLKEMGSVKESLAKVKWELRECQIHNAHLRQMY